MTISKSSLPTSQNGSALVMILVAVGLFAALSFALSQQGGAGKSLSTEKVNLLSTDVMDMGNKMADTIAQLRLHGVKTEQISFENGLVDHYDNPTCSLDKCKVFAYDGGGRDWETPAAEVSNGAEWLYTGSLAIKDVGTDAADLIAILPNIPLALCTRLNKMVGIKTAPDQFSGVTGDKYIGVFAASPAPLTSANIDGKTSACIELDGPSGSGFPSGLPPSVYAYYQVLSAR